MTEHDFRRHAAMIMAAAIKYNFRQPTDPTPAGVAAYVRDLIAHVNSRDWAAAHELRIGKPQAEWTPDDANGFARLLKGKTRTDHELDPGVHRFQGFDFGDGFPVTEACLRELANDSLTDLMDMRRKDATKELPILAVVLLTTGGARLLLPGSNDRIGLLKHLARTEPVFGFALTFDSWMHELTVADTEKDLSPTSWQTDQRRIGKATKRDALVQHIITRDLRLIRRRTYGFEGTRAVFDEPAPPDIDVRVQGPTVDDPYAELFVTVPRSGVPQ